jgi:tetratricopeptide (TPR) repeat protein
MDLHAQDESRSPSGYTLALTPELTLPLLSGDLGKGELLMGGWGGGIRLERALPKLMPFTLRAGLSYATFGFQPTGDIETPGRLHELDILAGMGASKDLNSKLALTGFADAGATFGILSDGDTAAYAALRAGAGLSFKISSSLAARLAAAFDYKAGLYGGPMIGIGAAYAIPAPSSARIDPSKLKLLDFPTIKTEGVFPIFRSRYDQSALGSVTIVNTDVKPVKKVRLTFFMKQYMDAPKECAFIPEIGPGETAVVPLYALFNDRILNVTEPTKASAEIVASYDAAQADGASQSRTATVLVYDRNALTWSDDRHAAAFVSNKDPWVQGLTGHILAAVKGDRNKELAKNEQTALAIHQGLSVYGLGYMIGTTRPFAKGSSGEWAVDSLKFPRQTLAFRSGDCADLSVLYASCLEAAGVETAFATVPGHIFIAVDLGLTETEALARGMDKRDLIAYGDRLWLPIETTLRNAGFLEAWRKAAEEWRASAAKGDAAFYPMHEAWKEYEPVGLPDDGSAVSPPPAALVLASFKAELEKAVDAELAARLRTLSPIPDDLGEAATLNQRGIIYARYGRLTEASREFEASIRAGGVAAIVNLGNIDYMKGDLAAALAKYQRAAAANPEDPKILASVAMAASALGQDDVAESALARMKKLDPQSDSELQPGAKGRKNTGKRQAEAGDADPLWR